jgi:hypothetical protein
MWPKSEAQMTTETEASEAMTAEACELTGIFKEWCLVHDQLVCLCVADLAKALAAARKEAEELRTAVREHEECIGELEYAKENANFRRRLDAAKELAQRSIYYAEKDGNDAYATWLRDILAALDGKTETT